MNRHAFVIRLLIALSSILLGLGLVAPCMTITPSMGEAFDTWLALLDPDELNPTTYSIFGGIMAILTQDNRVIGALLLGFSVLFPAFKLAALWLGLSALQKGRPGGLLLWLTHHAGKFSMVDVMVIAVLIVAIKGLPGETTVTIGWGLYAFAGSVLLSMVTSTLISRLEKRHQPISKTDDAPAA